jgi:hypothetical protein
MLTVAASNHIRKIVDTAGSDISHLMSAMGELHKLFRTLVYFIIIAILIICVAFVIGFFSVFV